MNTYGFIGCGNMGGILAACCAKRFGADTLLCDHNTNKTAAIAEKTGAIPTDAEQIAMRCRYIFFGVKPQALPALLTELQPLLDKRSEKPVLVSMAAGVCIDKIAHILPDCPIIRIMPSTPAEVGKGVILYCPSKAVTEIDIRGFLDALSEAGTLEAIDEDHIDAASALSGCGPAFVYLFIEALADGAVKCGLARDKALALAARTVSGAGEMVLQSQKHPARLKDAVCSPGGSTIAGIAALEEHAFRAAAIAAVEAAYKRTKELAELSLTKKGLSLMQE